MMTYFSVSGLAVGEIPSLMVQGTLWRNQMLYNFLSDSEILRLQFRRLSILLSCYRMNRTSYLRYRPILLLTHDEREHNYVEKAWHYTEKHFFKEQIQDNIKLSISTKQTLDKEKSKDEK
jgi:hypothetical protein